MSDKREATPSDLALAIDIGATKMAVGLVTRRGEMVDRKSSERIAIRTLMIYLAAWQSW